MSREMKPSQPAGESGKVSLRKGAWRSREMKPSQPVRESGKVSPRKEAWKSREMGMPRLAQEIGKRLHLVRTDREMTWNWRARVQAAVRAAREREPEREGKTIRLEAL